MKKNIQYLRDVVDNEGLGYAIYGYLGRISEEEFDVDHSVIEAWNAAETALRELDKLLGLGWL